ncbi:MAG: hypothetical protein AB1758_19490, partial [Candidatus Eremiobacterota bacterium]
RIREKADAISHGINYGNDWKTRNDPHPCIAAFDRLTREKPDLAREVAAELAQRSLQGANEVLLAVGSILQHGSHKATALFAPHVERLSHVVSGLEERGELKWNSSYQDGRTELYRGLLHRFPELGSPELLADQLLPLVLNHVNSDQAGDLLLQQFERHPEWTGSVMDRFVAEPRQFYVPEEQWKVLQGAVERGWEPTPLQVDWLASWLYQPCRTEDDSLSRKAKVYGQTLTTLKALEERKPGLLSSVRLPDPAGRMVSWKEAALARILADPQGDTRDFFAPRHKQNSQVREGIREIYDALFPDRELQGRLLERVESGFAAAGGIDRMTGSDQLALVILGSIQLDRDQESRLEALALQERHRDQGWYPLNDVVDVYRQRFNQARMDILKDPAASVQEKVQAALEHCATSVHRVLDFEMANRTHAPVEALAEALGPEATLREGRKLLQRFVDQAEVHQNLGDIPGFDQTALWVAHMLGARHPELQVEVEQALRPLLLRPLTFKAQPVRLLITKAWDERSRELRGQLTASTGTHADREALLADLRDLDNAYDRFYDRQPAERPDFETVSAWRDGLPHASDWGRELAAAYVDPEKAYEAYQAVTRGSAGWEEFVDLHRRLGGESYHEDILAAFRRYQERRAAGDPPEVARDAALLGYLDVAPAPDESASAIQEKNGQLRVGGVVVRTRRRA